MSSQPERRRSRFDARVRTGRRCEGEGQGSASHLGSEAPSVPVAQPIPQVAKASAGSNDGSENALGQQPRFYCGLYGESTDQTAPFNKRIVFTGTKG